MAIKKSKEFKAVVGYLGVGIFLLILLGTMGAGSMKMEKEEIQVTGGIYVMGNEPFTQVAIRLDDGKVYALIGEYDKELRSIQGKRVTITGKPGDKTPRGAESLEVKSFKVVETK